ncbi:Tripartite ATP-independent periplasmic transporter, DctQ component [Puniceibacterium sp. IMCC21224]|nr:Tripartite ATP-independent periplasmic transporter, DctQ component [Puniceibacterium sp. IMCC21224]
MSILAIVFVQFPHAFSAGRVVRMRYTPDLLLRRAPRVFVRLEMLFALLGVISVGILAYALWLKALGDFTRLDQYGSPGVFQFPKWPIRAIAALGATVLTIQFLIYAAHMAERRNDVPQ